MFIIKEGTAADKIGEGTDDTTKAAITSYLEKNGYVIRTADQDKQHLEANIQPGINKVLGERNTQLEQSIATLTGVQKTQGEKWNDYMERAFKEKTARATELEAKIAEMERKGTDGSALATQYKQQLEQTQAQIQAINSEWETKYNKLGGTLFETKVMTQADSLISKIRTTLRQDIDPSLQQDIIDNRLAKWRRENTPKDVDGHIHFLDETGKTRISKQDGKPISMEESINPYFADLIDKKRTQGGAGSGGEGGKGDAGAGGETPKWKATSLPATVSSKVKLHDWLQKELKLDVDSKDFSEAYAELGKNLPMRG